MIINEVIEGELTRKQKQRLETIYDILRAFYNERNEKTPRTWNDLTRITRLSSGTLSKYLKELVRQGVVRGIIGIHKEEKEKDGEIKIRERLIPFYEYTEGFLSIKGKKRTAEKIPGNVCRIWFNDKGIAKYELGSIRKKYGKQYFVPLRS